MKKIFVPWCALLLSLDVQASQIEEQPQENDLWKTELKTRAPENDQILFTVQNNTPEIMPIGLRITIWDENYKSCKKIDIGSLKKEVQAHSSVTVKQSECELMAWVLDAYNSLALPLNCEFMISVDFNWTKAGKNTGTYSKSTSLCYGNMFDQIISGGSPLGGKFVVNEEQYISHTGIEVKSFDVSLRSDVNASESGEESQKTDPLGEQNKGEQEAIAESKSNIDESNDLKTEKRTPENDQTLFTVENNTSEIIPVGLSISIVDGNFMPHKWIDIEQLKTEVKPNSYLTVKQSECELMAWILHAFNKSDVLPLNCQFIIGVNFNYGDNFPFDGPFGGSAQTLCYGNHSGHKIGGGFPIGGKFVVNEERYTSHLGKEVKSFKASRL